MNESAWMVMTLWIILLAFGYRMRSKWMLRVVAGIIGLLFSINILADKTVMLQVTGFSILMFNIYVLYGALLMEEPK